ncbi:ABC transporter ATP-binding protein [Treponema pedis]|uniref:ABC transporter ATP-binding protein n=1 Tax=Treponema pedis str. T A4 TaxID=1291379 RepID=S5ZM43_9SPIR|nr:ABC transporter ATP-binding protein [Treponema pedis]AGT43657.1 ABC transporter ATP-binding protein [Treponema pedis str. T A4]
MNILQIEHLNLSYGSSSIIEDLNISVRAGQIVSIIGPNASGKSTILKAIAGILKPASGKIFIEGKDISKMKTKELAKKVSILLQQNKYPDEITVEELIFFGRYPHKNNFEFFNQSDNEIVKKVLQLTNTFGLRHKTLETLSGGERQRTWIAMALAQEPSILLFDEPTTFLDPAHQIEFLELVNGLNKKTNTAIILVLHDLNQAARYGNYIFALKDKKLFVQGTPEKVLTPENILSIYNIKTEVVKVLNHLTVVPISNI